MSSDFLVSEREWRVLICGGREYGFDKDPVTKKLTVNFEQTKKAYDVMGDLVAAAEAAGRTLVIIHGAAKGADTLADDASNFFGVKAIPFPANWDRDKRAAGPIRNRQMLKEGHPHLVVAFPGGTGTADMIAISEKAGIPVRRIKL